MNYGSQMLERTAMQEQIDALETKLNNIHSDFAKCAKGNISPCFFCANDETCDGRPTNCNFKWQGHN